MENILPLNGLKVVSIEQAVAAPFASARLADAGAHVVKIERPEGDFARGYDDVAAGQSSYFVWLNRGKESVTLDLMSEIGQARLGELIAEADVLIQNLKPGALDRLGFHLDELHKKYPKLISCSISGYGESGPMADRKAYDLLVQAESGLCAITGGPDQPARVGISIVDIASGINAYCAILEAVIRCRSQGIGAQISISMFDVMAEWLTVPLLNHEGGKTPKRIGLAHPSIAPYGAFHVKNGGTILLSIQSEREWVSFCRNLFGDDKYVTDPRFAKNVDRVKHRPETDALIGQKFASMTMEEVVATLEKANIAFASVNDMERLSKHPHLRRITVNTPNGPVSMPTPAPVWSGEIRSYGPVPPLHKLET